MRRASEILVLLAVILPACGGGGGGGGGAPPAPPPATGFRVLQSGPRDGEYFVPVDKILRITFSAPIFPASLPPTKFVLAERVSGDVVPGALAFANGDREAVFTPSIHLSHNLRYRFTVASGVRSVGGETLANEFTAYFRTAVTDDEPPPPPPAQPRGEFRPVGDLLVGRSNHTATLLDGEAALVTGGYDTATTLTKTAELFDPLTETFSRTGQDMTIERAFHAACRLEDGRVLIAGGVTGASQVETEKAEFYDPGADTFAASSSSMVRARAFHTMTRLADGRVLVTGGTVPGPSGTFSSREAEIFSPLTGAFGALPNMAVYRAGHTATLLADGRVLLMGGNSSDKRIELFDPATDRFTTLSGEMKVARRGHTSTLLLDGTIVAMGGGSRTAEIVEPGTGSSRWTFTYPFYDRKDHTANLLPSGHVFFTGGSYLVGTQLFFQQTTEMYEPTTGAFLGNTPALAWPRVRHRALQIATKKILVTGGQNTDPAQPELVSAEIYELE